MRTALEIILTLVIIGAALAFGGVQPLVYSLMEVVLFVAALLLLLKPTRERSAEVKVPLWPVLFAALVVLEVAPLPRSLVARISPARLASPRLESLGHSAAGWTTLKYLHTFQIVISDWSNFSLTSAPSPWRLISSIREPKKAFWCEA